MPNHDSVTLTGQIEDVFSHRFVLKTQQGKVLVDVTPKGLEQFSPGAGKTVTIEGEMKPSELKAHKISADGREIRIEHKPKPDPAGPKHHGPKHHHDDGPKHQHDPSAALAAVRKAGYDVLAEPQAKPKHVEILARRDGETVELHVELDGHIRKTKPIKDDEPKWAGRRATTSA